MNVNVTIKGKRRNPLDIFGILGDVIKNRLPRVVANEFRKEVIRNIETNRFNFELNPSWESYKRSIGADTRPFIMFGHYMRNISVMKSGVREYTIGFPKGVMHPRAGVSYGELARHLEIGDADKGIPARPLWRRSGDEFFVKSNRDLSRVIIKTINSEIN